jgi:3-oxoacyl-[acyl-carrier-protein] synthase-3
MLKSILNNVSISCLCASVPYDLRYVKDDWTGDEKDIKKIISNTGVQSRHVVDQSLCTSDLCFQAAQKIIHSKGMAPEDIDGLIFVSQTPDFFLPATGCSLHGRLGLSKNCAVFDVNLGCSGYVYGLWLASSLISSGSLKKVLLLAGDTITKLCPEDDRSTWPLFGDSGSATLLEYKADAPSLNFVLGTDGQGTDKLIVRNGGFRNPGKPSLYMSGSDIFTFTIREVPPMIKEVLELAGYNKDEIDYYVFHQANMFILNHLSKKMKLEKDKVLISLDRFGNTSSASIPLTIVTNKNKITSDQRIVLSGFGVGFSWSALAFDTKNFEIYDLETVGVE